MSRRPLWPWLIRVGEGYSGWYATYRTPRESWRVSGLSTKAEALADLRSFVRERRERRAA